MSGLKKVGIIFFKGTKDTFFPISNACIILLCLLYDAKHMRVE